MMACRAFTQYSRRRSCEGDAREFRHWARVAAEVVKVSNKLMNIKAVEAIVDEWERQAAW
jgi:hypothetical protein